MTNELKLRMTEIARKWMRPDSEAAPEFYWGDFCDCVAEIMGAAGASEGQSDTYDVRVAFEEIARAISEHEPLDRRVAVSMRALNRWHQALAKFLYATPPGASPEIAALRERIAGMEKDAAPAGWKLVPIEPTEGMVIDGFESEPSPIFSAPEVWGEYEQMSGCRKAAHRARLCYAAMLNAAPQCGADKEKQG